MCAPTASRLGWCAPTSRALWEDPVRYRKTVRDNPLQRIGEPDEIAGAAVFLASAAGSFVTGHTLVVDGGTMAGVVLQKDD
jgi:NAD(P)-dependent dehydrogenase (short-subunit alcohol dehydrogenase family)